MRTTTRSLICGLTVFTGLTLACGAGEPTGSGRESAPGSVAMSLASGGLVVGQSFQLAATVFDVQHRVQSGAAVAWTTSDQAVVQVSPTGLVTGMAPGTATVTASLGAISGTSVLTVSVPTPATAAWTFCVAAGDMCWFDGLRDVRLADATGAHSVQVTAFHSVPCAMYGFNNQNPAPGKALHCDYGPIKTATLVNPMPGMAGLGASVTVPLGSLGSGDRLVQATSETPVRTDGSGSFRTTCSVASFGFNDPIVLPGQPGASHLHVFFGNTGVNASSTVETIASSGNSTCRGGTLNRTAYWVPAVVDSRTGEVQTPQEGVFYYKTGYNVDPTTVRTLPAGLRMIAGNKSATAIQEHVVWECRDSSVPNTGTIPSTCPVGDAVRLTIVFPQCWDGKNLDSPDHKSHMAYPVYRNAPQRSSCPATHPVTLPEITEHFDYEVRSTSAPAYWRLASDMYSTSLKGGFSAHADWMGGWDPETFNTIVTKCLNKAVDCGVGSIGNGTELFQ